MSAKHTPGPWKRRKEWKSDDFALEIYPDKKVDFGSPAGICVVGDVYDEAVANARLIAAAPELFEALKLCLAFQEGLKNPACTECVVKARAAIAKATGEAAS